MLHFEYETLFYVWGIFIIANWGLTLLIKRRNLDTKVGSFITKNSSQLIFNNINSTDIQKELNKKLQKKINSIPNSARLSGGA